MTSALVYPGVLATVSLGVIIFLITFVLPRMSGVFTEMGNDLPLTTKRCWRSRRSSPRSGGCSWA